MNPQGPGLIVLGIGYGLLVTSQPETKNRITDAGNH